jgi:hypothetical protein
MIGEILWPVAFVIGVYRFSKTLELFSPDKVAKLKAIEPPATVPEDLVALALQENEPWAQEEVMRAVRERYEDLGDWNAVRSAMGIGRID